MGNILSGNPGQLDSGVFDASSGPYTLTLNLMRLSDGSTQQVASLLSPDYPANFQTAAEQAIQASPDTYKGFHSGAIGEFHCANLPGGPLHHRLVEQQPLPGFYR